MSLFQVVITAVLATLATIAFGIVAIWSLWPAPVEASVAVAAHSSTWATAEQSHCDHFGAEQLQFAEAVVSAALELDDHQQTDLAAISTKVEHWRSQTQAICSNADLGTLDGSLAGIDAMLTQSSTAFGDLRPLIGAFYAGLSTEQQATLQALMHAHKGFGRHRRAGSGYNEHGHGQ